MITVTVNRKEIEVADLAEARKVFNAKVSTRASRMKQNDGLVRVDGTPTCQFSFNGRLWPTEEFRRGEFRTKFPAEEIII